MLFYGADLLRPFRQGDKILWKANNPFGVEIRTIKSIQHFQHQYYIVEFEENPLKFILEEHILISSRLSKVLH